MFPTLVLGDITLYMTGIGIVCGLISFLIAMGYYCRRYGLSFVSFFQTLPVLLILPYLLGGWSYIAIEHNILYPSNWQDLINIITPFEYTFHFVGIALGLMIYMIGFLSYYGDSLNTQKRWIDALILSLCIACIPLGLFLLLGDDFIGRENQYGIFSVASLTSDSELSKYVKVYPLGLGLSLVGLIGWVMITTLKTRTKKSGQGLIGLTYLFLMFAVLFVFQIYPRHGVRNIGNGIILDIKNYLCILGAVASLVYYIMIQHKHKL